MTKKSVDANHIFNFLAGKWSLNRKFVNNIDKDFSGTASGITEFLGNNDNSLSYNESVIAHFDNGTEIEGAAFYKFYIKDSKIHQYLVADAKDKTIEDHMFELNFSNDNNQIYACASYLCGMDKYKVSYSFFDDNKFNVTYTVLGPNKNFITETEFEKIVVTGDHINIDI